MISAQRRPHSSSLHRAASAIRKSPGGSELNSSRSRPLEPPLSATVTMAVISVVIVRSARSVAAKPWPPPKETTFLSINVLFLDRDVSHEPRRYVPSLMRGHQVAEPILLRPQRYDASRRCIRSPTSKTASLHGNNRAQ